MLYLVIRQLFRVVFSLLFRWKIEGHDHIPNTGPVVVCSNHIHILDPPLVGCAMQRVVHFMAKEELFRIPILSSILRQVNAFPVRRGAGDLQSLKHSIRLLKHKQVLGIFPEGTRGKQGKLGKGHPGAAMFALKTNSPIIPTAIIGPYRIFRPVRIIFGEPIDLSAWKKNHDMTEAAKILTDVVMENINQLIQSHSVT